MRTPIIARQLEMQHAAGHARSSWRRDCWRRIDGIEGVEKIVCPPFVYIHRSRWRCTMTSIKVGAQNVHWEDDVAATGEVGPQHLARAGRVRHHRPLRAAPPFGETDEMVNRKVKAALDAGLQPDHVRRRDAGRARGGKTDEVLVRQTTHGLRTWRCRTGSSSPTSRCGRSARARAATADDADQAISLIRREVADMFGAADGRDGAHPLRRQRDAGEHRGVHGRMGSTARWWAARPEGGRVLRHRPRDRPRRPAAA